MDRVALTRQVRGHVPADDAEAAHRLAVLELLATSAAPFSRSTVAPGHVTASAFVICPDMERVLLIHHAFLRLWLQPGGHVEVDDADLASACRREIVEETGVSSLMQLDGFPNLLDIDVHAIPANPRKGEAAHRHFDLRTLWLAQDDALVDTGEVLAVRWVPFDQLDELTSDASVRRAVGRIRAKLGR